MRVFVIKIWAVICIPFIFYSCAPIIYGGAAAGGTIWYKGELKESVTGSVEEVHNATVQALKNLKFTIKKSNKDKLQSEVQAEMANGKKVKTTLKSDGKNVTEIRIRVGIMGDEKISRRIIDEIKTILNMNEKKK